MKNLDLSAFCWCSLMLVQKKHSWNLSHLQATMFSAPLTDRTHIVRRLPFSKTIKLNALFVNCSDKGLSSVWWERSYAAFFFFLLINKWKTYWPSCEPWQDLLLRSEGGSQASQPSSPLVVWILWVHSPELAILSCWGVLALFGLWGICGVRGPLLSLGFGGGGVGGRGFSSWWYCKARSQSGFGSGSKVEKVIRSSTTGGSVMRGLGYEISGSEGVRSPREGALLRGGTRGGTSRPRPRAMEARREPPPTKARWVLFIRPPREPLSGCGEPAGEDPPSSLPESPRGRGRRRLSFADKPAQKNVFDTF